MKLNLKLLKVFESARLTKPIPLTELSPGNRFFGGSHGHQHLFKISKTLGVPFTAYHVKENHAIAIAKLRCEQQSVGAVEAELWNRAEKWLGEEAAKWVALLCDWALMSPNPNMINQKPGEIHPGSRFLKGLEALSKLDM